MNTCMKKYDKLLLVRFDKNPDQIVRNINKFYFENNKLNIFIQVSLCMENV